MPEQATLLDELIDAYVGPPDDPAGRARTLTTLRKWMWAVETKDLELMGRIMSADILIELPFSESGRSEPGTYRAFRAWPSAWSSGASHSPWKRKFGHSRTWS